MKKILILLSIMFCSVAFAHTIEWYVGDNLLSTTTCESGDNITPPTAPDKFGYHFKKWFHLDETIPPLVSYSHTSAQCYKNWSSFSCDDLDLDINEVKLEFADYTIYGKAICSDTKVTNIGSIGIPNESIQNLGSGGCFCKAIRIVDKMGDSFNVDGSWVQDYQYDGNCLIYCSAHCINNVMNNTNGARNSFFNMK